MDIVNYLNRFDKDELIKLLDVNILEYLHKESLTTQNICNLIIDDIREIFKDKLKGDFLLSKLTLNEYHLMISQNDNVVKAFYDFFGINIRSQSKYSQFEEIFPLQNKRFFELLDYQYIIKNATVNYLQKKEEENDFLNRLIIHMPTGTGKTKTTMHIVTQLYNDRKLKGNIIWLAHSTELLIQASLTFKNVWQALGCDKVNCYVQDFKTVEESNAIYFLNYQKLISISKKNPDIINQFIKNTFLIICDEAHKCLATESHIVIEKLMTMREGDSNKFLIGLTATPGRKFNDFLNEGENLGLALMFDKNIINIKPSSLEAFDYKYHFGEVDYKNVLSSDSEIIKYFQERKILSHIIREELSYDFSATKKVETNFFSNKSLKSDFSSENIRKLGLVKERNAAILNRLIELDKSNIQTIFFACSNEHGKLISNLLTLNGVKNKTVFGDTNELDREKYISSFNKKEYNILINNSVLTTGFDSPNIECVFISRPTNSIVLYSQMLGRGLRGPKMGGKDNCLLIDVKDNLNKFNDENFAFSYFEEYWGG